MDRSKLSLVLLVTTGAVALSSAASSQSLTGENARDIARIIAPPLEQLNNLRAVMTPGCGEEAQSRYRYKSEKPQRAVVDVARFGSQSPGR